MYHVPQQSAVSFPVGPPKEEIEGGAPEQLNGELKPLVISRYSHTRIQMHLKKFVKFLASLIRPSPSFLLWLCHCA